MKNPFKPSTSGYRWWTFMCGNSAVYGTYLKLGPLTIIGWRAPISQVVYVECCWMNRWCTPLLELHHI